MLVKVVKPDQNPTRTNQFPPLPIGRLAGMYMGHPGQAEACLSSVCLAFSANNQDPMSPYALEAGMDPDLFYPLVKPKLLDSESKLDNIVGPLGRYLFNLTVMGNH